MHGNVMEWCQDVYLKNIKAENQIDPIYEKGSKSRVIRGGGWNNGAKRCRSASRYIFREEGFTSDSTGFRLVMTREDNTQ
jgi:formylglycine-generating enzyme required for sulfatase activity